MSDPFFFGYGSLVNLATHEYADAHPARIKGWRRAWRHTPARDIAFLTAIPCEDSEIDGMIAHVPGGDWAALDEREYAYDRQIVTDAVVHTVSRPLDIAIYEVPASAQYKPDVAHPYLLSYLDVVVQGYLQVFGEDGAKAFFETTDGWDCPVRDDRNNPTYPRHQQLTPAERHFVDTQLAQRNVTILR